MTSLRDGSAGDPVQIAFAFLAGELYRSENQTLEYLGGPEAYFTIFW